MYQCAGCLKDYHHHSSLSRHKRTCASATVNSTGENINVLPKALNSPSKCNFENVIKRSLGQQWIVNGDDDDDEESMSSGESLQDGLEVCTDDGDDDDEKQMSSGESNIGSENEYPAAADFLWERLAILTSYGDDPLDGFTGLFSPFMRSEDDDMFT